MTTTTPYNLATHNGEITIRNNATGGHRTFKIKTQGPKATFCKGERILSLFTGKENTEDRAYTGFAFVKPDGRIALWGKYAKLSSDPKWRKYVDMLQHPEKYPGCDYMFSGTCRVCNRKLTNPESIESGIGPECAKR